MADIVKMIKTTINLVNSIHGTSTNVRVFEGQETLLERSTALRIRRELCPDKKCDKCKTTLKQIGETNPKIEEKDGNFYILYKVESKEKDPIKEVKDSGNIVKDKKTKVSEWDKEEKEKESNLIHFIELEAKIMASGLTIDEKTKLFDFIREIHNEERESNGLESL